MAKKRSGQIWQAVKSLSYTKEYDIIDPESGDYIPFLVNRAFSYYPDTILFAEEINELPFVTKRMHYDYYFYAIRPRSRFTKWAKKEDKGEEFQVVQEAFGFSEKKVMEALNVLSEQDVSDIKQLLFRGGTK